MTRLLSTDDLPPAIVIAIRPWIGIVQTLTGGVGEEVRITAENACTSLRQRVVMTPQIEAAMDKARDATIVFAIELDRSGVVPSRAKANLLIALDFLIAVLLEARPNTRAIGLGLDW